MERSDFNPRSREGSDWGLPFLRLRSMYFNPRSREGSDTISPLPMAIKRISIHAPAKGATFSYWISSILSRYFNPRSREGSDPRLPNQQLHYFLFQSTLPRRERRLSYSKRIKLNKFQSTLPRRERQIGPSRKIFAIAISIHAPAKGATPLN